MTNLVSTGYCFPLSMRPPQVRTITFLPCNRHIYCMDSGSIGLRFVSQTRPLHFSLICGFCSSVRDFASGFLQIPPHGGHPCLWLTVPTAKPVVDFHHQVIAHAGRTTIKEAQISERFLVLSFLPFLFVILLIT